MYIFSFSYFFVKSHNDCIFTDYFVCKLRRNAIHRKNTQNNTNNMNDVGLEIKEFLEKEMWPYRVLIAVSTSKFDRQIVFKVYLENRKCIATCSVHQLRDSADVFVERDDIPCGILLALVNAIFNLLESNGYAIDIEYLTYTKSFHFRPID